MPLFNQIRAGHRDAHFFAYYLEYLTFHMLPGRLEPALKWLVKNGVVGERFFDFVHHDCAGSALELIRNLTMRIEREAAPRALTIKDIRR